MLFHNRADKQPFRPSRHVYIMTARIEKQLLPVTGVFRGVCRDGIRPVMTVFSILQATSIPPTAGRQEDAGTYETGDLACDNPTLNPGSIIIFRPCPLAI